ncbi:hypothetical protein KJ910_00065 [Patescibacteria group bacterium]|nr:hypothetical protein [Patescibacteria group bacterium]MBU1906579.1 hypothetical protein [Patescibacteria group bacterium]
MNNTNSTLSAQLQAKRDKFAGQLDAVETILAKWQWHLMSNDIYVLATIGLLPNGLDHGRPNHDAMERVQLRLMNRLDLIDKFLAGDHGLSRPEFNRQAKQALEDIIIRPIDILESSLTPDP